MLKGSHKRMANKGHSPHIQRLEKANGDKIHVKNFSFEQKVWGPIEAQPIGNALHVPKIFGRRGST
jgi:hypothetical protein